VAPFPNGACPPSSIPLQPRRLALYALPLRQGPTRCHPSAVDDIGATFLTARYQQPSLIAVRFESREGSKLLKSNNLRSNLIASTKVACQIFLLWAGYAVLAGCSIAGRNFARPPFENFELGKTMRTEIVQSIGATPRVFTVEKNGKSMMVYEYTFSAAVIIPVEGFTAVGRIASFWFSDDILVGYGYESSYPGDSTDFDESKAALLVKGKSTRQEVEMLLGKPSGLAIYPLVDGRKDTLLLYYHIGTPKMFTIVSKKAIITIDERGIVSDIKLEIEEKKPK